MPHHIHINKKNKPELNYIAALIKGFNQILYRPVINFIIIFIIAFALFIPAGFYIVLKNINILEEALSQSAEITLYLKKSVNPKMAIDLAEQLKLNNAIIDIKLVTPDEGIKDFVKHTGFGEILLGFKENPLPQVIIIYPNLKILTEDQVKIFINNLKNLHEVEAVKIDIDWVERSCRLLSLWEYLFLVLAVLLNTGSLIIICCVAYITPLFISEINPPNSKRISQCQCFWHSLIGGVLAILLINFILMKLHSFGFDFQGLGINCNILLILSGILLGVISSKFAI